MGMFYLGIERRKREKGRPERLPCRLCQSDRMKDRLAGRRSIINEAKSRGCVDCGITNLEHPEIFDFDHTSDDKTANVAAFATKGTIADLLAEIAKCEVVCANCHRIRTFQRRPVGFGRSRVNT